MSRLEIVSHEDWLASAPASQLVGSAVTALLQGKGRRSARLLTAAGSRLGRQALARAGLASAPRTRELYSTERRLRVLLLQRRAALALPALLVQLGDSDHETVVATLRRELGMSQQEVQDVLEVRARHLTGTGRHLLDVEIEGARRQLIRLRGTQTDDAAP